MHQLQCWLAEAQKASSTPRHHLTCVQNLRIVPFGSFVMGTSGCDSDLDVTLEGDIADPDISVTGRLSEAKRDFKIALLTEIHNLLVRGKYLYPWKGTRLIRDARVAISRFRENFHGTPCDLSIGNTIGIFKSRLLATVLDIDPRLRGLVVIVKRWAKAHGFDDSSNGCFNSHCLLLLVLTFAQTRSPPLLPPLKEIFPGLRSIVKQSKTDVQVDLMEEIVRFQDKVKELTESKRPAENKESISELLVAFFMQFSLFASHCYQIQTSPKRENQIMARPTSSCWKGGYVLYQWDQETTYRSLLFVEDPFCVEDNCARTLKCGPCAEILTTLRETAYFAQAFSLSPTPAHSDMWRELWALLFTRIRLRQLPRFNWFHWQALQWMYHRRDATPVSIVYHYPSMPLVYSNGRPCVVTTPPHNCLSSSDPCLTAADTWMRGAHCANGQNPVSSALLASVLQKDAQQQQPSNFMSNK